MVGGGLDRDGLGRNLRGIYRITEKLMSQKLNIVIFGPRARVRDRRAPS
ncbi:MAG: hypothetical protein IPH53_22990 [Flavobacteriales bacterium]|nr:hypothetical protein [Flavobacteriales bacterium]